MSIKIISDLKEKLSNFKIYKETSNSIQFDDVFGDDLSLTFTFDKNKVSMTLYFPMDYRGSIDTNTILDLNEENVSFYMYKGWVSLKKTFTEEEVRKLETITSDEIISEVSKLYNKF